MQAYPKYDSYKDSGVSWIGDIPEDWEVKPGFTALKENNIKNKGMVEEQVLSLSYGNVVIKPKEKLTGLVPESFETYQIIEPGYIIFRPTDLQNDVTSLRTGLARDKGIITSAYIALRPSLDMDARYTHYLLHSYDLMKVFYGLGSGLRQNISFVDFKRLPIVLPKKEIQTRIADLLDQKTQEIDQAIAKKQQLIELLKEQKAILINLAVTKGLNPDVTMKDSGVEWIGEIPEHWDVLPFTKYVSSVVDYRGKTPEKTDDGTFLVTARNITSGCIDYEASKEYVAGKDYKKIMKRGLPELGDVLFTTEAPLGGVAIVDKVDVAFAQRLVKFRVRENVFLPEFVKYSFMSGWFQRFIYTLATGSTALGIKASKFHKIKLPVPSISEQEKIISILKDRISFMDGVIDVASEAVIKMDELKQSYISNAVTGKIKI